MDILLTNDDGIYGKGLWSLWERLHDSHRVEVVAPGIEQSGVAHAFTLHHPVTMEKVHLGGDRAGWAVQGTPADCVKLAISRIFHGKPDLVLAGINAGDNTGVSHFYSGTVAAAREAALWGIPAIAASVAIVDEEQFRHAARFVADRLPSLLEVKAAEPIFISVNFPPVAVSKMKGARAAAQGRSMFQDDYVHRKDPRGRDYYWIYGNKPPEYFEPDSDDQAVSEGYISVTPFSIDATHRQSLSLLGSLLGDGNPPKDPRK